MVETKATDAELEQEKKANMLPWLRTVFQQGDKYAWATITP